MHFPTGHTSARVCNIRPDAAEPCVTCRLCGFGEECQAQPLLLLAAHACRQIQRRLTSAASSQTDVKR